MTTRSRSLRKKSVASSDLPALFYRVSSRPGQQQDNTENSTSSTNELIEDFRSLCLQPQPSTTSPAPCSDHVTTPNILVDEEKPNKQLILDLEEGNSGKDSSLFQQDGEDNDTLSPQILLTPGLKWSGYQSTNTSLASLDSGVGSAQGSNRPSREQLSPELLEADSYCSPVARRREGSSGSVFVYKSSSIEKDRDRGTNPLGSTSRHPVQLKDPAELPEAQQPVERFPPAKRHLNLLTCETNAIGGEDRGVGQSSASNYPVRGSAEAQQSLSSSKSHVNSPPSTTAAQEYDTSNSGVNKRRPSRLSVKEDAFAELLRAAIKLVSDARPEQASGDPRSNKTLEQEENACSTGDTRRKKSLNFPPLNPQKKQAARKGYTASPTSQPDENPKAEAEDARQRKTSCIICERNRRAGENIESSVVIKTTMMRSMQKNRRFSEVLRVSDYQQSLNCLLGGRRGGRGGHVHVWL